ncbi:hypothetical protein BC830DRAFT_1117657 [Chytriomyces sp. MP71]|nr:hypothetical protein BC830DRAFT_1117657 [Chytriomyces sp. MP71]
MLDTGGEDACTTKKLNVEGMAYTSCVSSVERVIAGLDGVPSVSLSLFFGCRKTRPLQDWRASSWLPSTTPYSLPVSHSRLTSRPSLRNSRTRNS